MIRALVFDLDDTLYPEHAFVRGGFAAVDRWLQERRGTTGFAAEAGRLFDGGQRGLVFDEALHRLGVSAPPSLIPTLVAVYREHIPQLELFPDAAWALGHFGPRCSLGLLTDGYSATQRNKVTALSIVEHFRAVVFTDDLGRENWKPSPVPFQRISEALAIPPEACAYVGDNPAKDFIGPNRLGWRTVHLRREGGEYAHTKVEDLAAGHRARHEIRSLYELEGLFS